MEIVDLLESLHLGFIIFAPVPPGEATPWFCQSYHMGERWQTEVAYRDETGYNVVHHIHYPDGTDLKLSAAYGVLAEYCKTQRVPGDYPHHKVDY